MTSASGSVLSLPKHDATCATDTVVYALLWGRDVLKTNLRCMILFVVGSFFNFKSEVFLSALRSVNSAHPYLDALHIRVCVGFRISGSGVQGLRFGV
jgi:hypothetical protein